MTPIFVNTTQPFLSELGLYRLKSNTTRHDPTFSIKEYRLYSLIEKVGSCRVVLDFHFYHCKIKEKNGSREKKFGSHWKKVGLYMTGNIWNNSSGWDGIIWLTQISKFVHDLKIIPLFDYENLKTIKRLCVKLTDYENLIQKIILKANFNSKHWKGRLSFKTMKKSLWSL